ncbi:hypothetical protein Tco_1528444 [Tanacetum coccineum]
MVAYLQKPEGSEAQIMDYLNASHIKYALIENPKIYISLIQQFWGAATARTTDDEEFPTQTQVADEATFTSVDVDARGAATTDIGLDVGQGSGTIHKTTTEGSLQQNELMDLVTKLTDRVEVLENDLLQTKKVYSSALTKLILRVKKLEKNVKTNKARRMVRIVISEDEDAKEDSSKQGRKLFKIDKDPTISLVHPEQDMEYDFDVSTAEGFTTASVPVTTIGIEISTANISVSTASATPEVSTAIENLVYIRRSA